MDVVDVVMESGNRNMKVTVQMNVYNAENYLSYSLGSIYKFADRIVIIDGAFNEKMPSQFSTDRTEAIVRDFHDVQGKIVYVKTSSKNQVEQRNKIWQYAIGDWLFLVDYDEVYRKSELVAAKKFLAEVQKDSYWVEAKVFINSLLSYFRMFYPRLFRIKKAMEYIAPNHLQCSEGRFRPLEIVPNLTMYHYSFVKDRWGIKRLQRKVELPEGYRDGKYIVPKYWKLKDFQETHPVVIGK